jgi:hypothetical protein
MNRYADLSLTAQTTYAETMEVVQAQTLMRSIAHLNGSFAKKRVKGSIYWYFQFRDIDQSVRQIYIGPDSERIQRLMKIADSPVQSHPNALARAAIEMGCAGILPKHFSVIRRLSEYGFFKAGGVLIGTHAFIAMGNLLGVSWTDGARTQDVDFAHAGKNISVGLPADIKVDIHAAIDSLEMGLLPIQSFKGGAGATYLNPEEPELRIDFLTAIGREGGEPFNFEKLNIALQPLKFMEFSLENTTQATLLSRDGALLVNIPSPIRYGLHKLIVYGERSEAFRTKATKDILQSAALISWYANHQPDTLRATLEDLMERGPGWRKRAKQGIAAVTKLDPTLEPQLLHQSVKRGVSRVRGR